MTGRTGWRWVRPVTGAVILLVVLGQVGGQPFRDGLRALDTRAVLIGAVIALATTSCAAWRWRLVASRLGAGLSMSAAIASYYRSTFLNLVLPGGVLGDVDRGVQHGREVEDVRLALRTVAWERTAGQVVLATLAVVAALLSPFAAPATVLTVAAVAVTALVVGLTVRTARRGGAGPLVGVADVAVSDARTLLSAPVSAGLLVSSLAAVAGHVATFAVAARAVGVDLPARELVPVAVLVLLVAAVPLSLAGWGPREGAAAWVFSAVGAQASEGLAVSVAYGIIVLIGALPGLVVLLLGRVRPAVVSVDA